MTDLLESLILIGQSYNDSIFKFKLGVSVVAITIMLLGPSLIFKKSKPDEPPTAPLVKWTGLAISLIAGLALLVYTWFIL